MMIIFYSEIKTTDTKKVGKLKCISGMFENSKDPNWIDDKYSHLYDLCFYQAKQTRM